ncbi:MAG: metallophosphoesterase [Chitinophagaceae bacterium]|nr:metallophosphoesterase [Chitinophagaceae bacterium]
MLDRRSFLQHTMLASGAALVPARLEEWTAIKKLTILHTNDTHSRIDPFPMDGSRNQGQGGVAARAALIDKLRKEEDDLLLLDAGDIFQGTPYFNLYKGEPEIRCMSAMGYDAATIGNHDFDAGLENLANKLTFASFPIIICNYDFSGTPMEHKYVPYKVFNKGKLKVGITGVGIQLHGLVPENLYGATKYLSPVEKANETASYLRKEKNCDMVICLSHLGYKYKDNTVSDVVLARESEEIDLIIGGHTHTFMDKPESFVNKKGKPVLVNQVGWAGLQLGRLDFEFSKFSRKNLVNSTPIPVTKKTKE